MPRDPRITMGPSVHIAGLIHEAAGGSAPAARELEVWRRLVPNIVATAEQLAGDELAVRRARRTNDRLPATEPDTARIARAGGTSHG